jgi:hypothetical protein
MFHRLLAIPALHLLSFGADATQLVELEVGHKANVYEIQVEMLVDAPAENVRAILTDYANLDRLSDTVTSSRVIDEDEDGTVRVLTQIKNCILFFCMNLRKVEDITEDDRGRILVNMVPDSSNFRSGHASWELRGSGGATRVIHHATLEPDIRIPAWMGIAILKDSLRKEIVKSFETLDRMARRRCVPNAGDGPDVDDGDQLI